MATPFSENRFEHERRHLYFLPADTRSKIETAKPLYIIGARGTGKTTLLQALNWEERSGNRQLTRQLANDPFKTGSGYMFGVYIKIAEHAFRVVDLWANLHGEEEGFLLRGKYVEYLWSEILVRGLARAVAAGATDLAPETEQFAVMKFVAEWEHAFERLRAFRPGTLGELARALRFVRQDYEAAARRRLEVAKAEARIGVFTQPGEMIGELTQGLANALTAPDADPTNSWYFKVCMDEGETLSGEYKTVVNGFVRVSKAPLFLVMSYAQVPAELIETPEERLSVLPTVDVDLIRLDRIPDAEYPLGVSFEHYVNGVARTRIDHLRQAATGERGEGSEFNVRKFAGGFNLNATLLRLLSKSVAEDARNLIARAREMESHPFFRAYESKDDHEGGSAPAPPIYQTYLVEKLKLDLPSDENAPEWTRHAQDSAELRSRMVAAYMAVCDEHKIDIEYSSAETLINLCDNCIRDFLGFANEMCVLGKVALDRIDTATIPPEIQSRAVRAVSKRKIEGVQERPLKNAKTVAQVVRGLGLMTAAIQRRGRNYTYIRSPERGKVQLRTQLTELPQVAEARRLLLQGAEWGYLTLLNHSEHELLFRVHTSLAPAFGFSYRGAYHQARIRWADIMSLLNAGEGQLDAIVASWIGMVDEQPELPFDD